MQKYVNHDNFIDHIGNEFDNWMEEDNLKQAIAQKEGWQAIQPENYPARKAEWEQHYRRQAEDRVNDVKKMVQESIAEDQAKISRAQVKIVAGDYLVSDYAILHKITAAEAREELERYAAAKTQGFDVNNIADKFAAMRHRDHLNSREDMETAAQISKELETRSGISQAKKAIQRGESILGQNAWELIERRHTSGYALLKMIHS